MQILVLSTETVMAWDEMIKCPEKRQVRKERVCVSSQFQETVTYFSEVKAAGTLHT